MTGPEARVTLELGVRSGANLMRGHLMRSLGFVALWMLSLPFAPEAGCLLSEEPDSGATEKLPPGAVLRLGSSRLHMRSFVHKVGFLADGRSVIATDGSEFRCWDTEDGALQRTIRGPFDVDGAFSPDRSLFLSGGMGMKILRLEKGEFVECPSLPLGSGSCVALTDGGALIALASEEGWLTVWRDQGEARAWSSKVSDGRVWSVSIAPDGRALATVAGGKVALWDLASGSSTHTWSVAEGRCLAFSPDGRLLAVGCNYRPTRILDVGGDHEPIVLEDKPAALGPVAFSPDGLRLVTGGCGGEVVVWSVTTGRPVAHCIRHDAPVFCVAFSPDGTLVASGASDNTVRLWDAQTGAAHVPHRGHSGLVMGVAFTSDGERILSCDSHTSVRVWSARDGQELSYLKGKHVVAVSGDGATIACGGPERSLQIIEASSGRTLTRLDRDPYGVRLLRFSPDDRSLLISDGGGNLDLANIERGTFREWVPKFHEAVTGIGITPDGERCILGTRNGPLACFSWKTEECLWKVEEVTGAGAVAVSPDGGIVAVLFAKERERSFSVQLFSVRDGRTLGTIEPGTARDRSWTSGDEYRLEFAANGRVLVALDARGVLRLYELATGELMCSFQRETQQTFGFAVSPRAAHAATGESDGTVLVWSLLALDDSSAGLGVDDCLRDLSSPDAAVSYRAMCRLRALGTETVEWIAKDIDPAAPAGKPLEALVQELDHAEAVTREMATDALRQAGEEARACLETCLADTPTAEARERAQQILDDLDAGRIRDTDGLRAVRAVWVLECFGSPEARAVLERLAAGAPGARLTMEAAAALRRME